VNDQQKQLIVAPLICLVTILIVAPLIIDKLVSNYHGTPEAADATDTDHIYDITTLFTKDGCTMYKFYDGGYAHYFSNCRGAVTGQCQMGKVTHIEEIPTN